MTETTANELDQFHFQGQQADERVLYIATPHPIKFWVNLGKVLLAAAVATAFIMLITRHVPALAAAMGGRMAYRIVALLCVIWIWWISRSCKVARSYITDRRVVRFDAVFPFMEKKRSLFWGEVTKTKGESNPALRAFNIGTVHILPFAAEHADIRIHYTWYFEDLSSYIDKLLHTYKKRPEEMAAIRPFVAKPKGKRYTQSGPTPTP